MKTYKRGDRVEVNIDSGMGVADNWVPAIVTNATDPKYGWTAARTDPNSDHPGISRGPGWNQDEIREVKFVRELRQETQIATLMELIRGLLDLSRMVDSKRTANVHRRVITTALPCITGNVDVLFHDDLIQVVFKQEGVNG